MVLETWAVRWGVPMGALAELRTSVLGLDYPEGLHPVAGTSEAAVQAGQRLDAPKHGARLWRNNVGVLEDERGVPVRYGLANDSTKVNKVIKSGDLIGMRSIQIGPEHLGRTFGQFVSRECKPGGWRYTGTPRETAQLAWANLVNSLGGDARFVTTPHFFGP
jgi:hypothetical protein